ncbi:NAD(P)H-hydrate dehydratase [Fulvivirga sediminis]|uniref:Bifunctional NAD(P)H-hydrate repair enzyme n=1 Tax=Fulvivirga sediminis TaxID=2803949 RepID=A0A937F9E4_9BACT|nr:NAD(P)H-hydrate dehydratase [Fulvivirga sediminis]MBL3658907.1 NAD(P)H-hydrate dehydratase [Fulvivirga sediminis]
MKIISAAQTQQVDQYTIENEPIKSIDLMERASSAFVDWFTGKYDPKLSVAVVCGTGNNGGDGLAIARMLHERHYKITVFVVRKSDSASEDFTENERRLADLISINTIADEVNVPEFHACQIIIDAMFGSGLSRPVEGVFANVITSMNQAKGEIVSVDIASGLFADEHSASGAIVEPDYTISFQLPKLAFMFPENAKYVGEWIVRDIGLSSKGIEQQNTSYYYLNADFVKSFIKKRAKFSHKGNNGRALIMAGSYGKMGAAVLSAIAALRSGVGLLTMYIPSCGYQIMQSVVPEAMAQVDEGGRFLTSYAEESKYDVIGIGPGIGKEQETVFSVMQAIQSFDKPLVVDADGLNIIADHKEILDTLPENSILTPHPKEFERLAGKWNNDFERLEMQKKFSQAHGVILILKGAHTSVSTPQGEVFFNSTGNSGMATGGMGDVLTGVVTSMLAQGYEPAEAAFLAVFFHGLAADIIAENQGIVGIKASDVADSLPAAFKIFH